MILQPSKISLNVANRIQVQSQSHFLIGGGTQMFTFDELEPYFTTKSIHNKKLSFKFKDYGINLESEDHYCTCKIPMHILLPKLTVVELKLVAVAHSISVHSRMHAAQVQALLKEHMCENCKDFSTGFEVIDVDKHAKMINLNAVRKYQKKKGIDYKASHQDSVKKNQEKQGEKYKVPHLQSVKKDQEKQGEEQKVAHLQSVKKHQEKQGKEYNVAHLQSVKKYQEKQGEEYNVAHLQSVKKNQEKQGKKYKRAHLISVKKHQKQNTIFPPIPPTLQLQHKIISDACQDMMPCVISESGCAVCGKLTPIGQLTNLTETKLDCSILTNVEVTRSERIIPSDPITGLDGPILEQELDSICEACHNSMAKNKIPVMALANGKWLGKIPEALRDLSYTEQLIIA